MTTTTAVLLGIFLLGISRPAGAGDILGAQKLTATLRPHQSKAWVIGLCEWYQLNTVTLRQKGHATLVMEVRTPDGALIGQQGGDGRFMRLAWDPRSTSVNTYLVRVWNWSAGPAVTVTVETRK